MSHKSLISQAMLGALALAAWLQPTVAHAQAPAARDLPALVVLVRHAEKASEPKDDPPLTAAGTQRAQHLAAVFRDAKLSGVITTQYMRMRDTAQPVATALQLTPAILPVEDVYDTAQIDRHVKAVITALRKNAGRSVLVVTHGNMTHEIIAALGGPRLPRICDPVYDHLFVLAPTPENVQFVSARYGTPSPPPGPDCM
jgi:broad specificity phosphatase PhoE